ncbi:MAG: nucleotidyltransferase domain-containing protein [Bacillota bacterium]
MRGTNNPESDIDILILVEKEDRISRDIIMDIVVDVNLDYDVVISPILINHRN